jgi:hypothetical protein
VKEAMNKPPENEFEDWLNEHGPEMEGEDDCESLMFAAWKAAQLSPSCMNCAAVDLLIQRVQELEEVLVLAEHKIDQYLQGQYPEGNSLGRILKAIRVTLAGKKEEAK